MKRILVMLGISLLVVSGFLAVHAEAHSATSARVYGIDRELTRDTQRQLKALGFNPGDIDGNFGSQTEAAVRAYQQKYRLPETGKMDEATLRSLLPGRFEATRAPTDFPDREVILQAQRQLKALGFNPGDIDGNFGPQMEAALRAYQQNYRLPQTGQLDDVTQRSLLPGRFEARAPTDSPDREVILQAQRQLKALGFNPGDIDGNLGSQTEAAVRAYQQKYRLPETGKLDETVLRSLLPERTQAAPAPVQAAPAPVGLSDRELVRRAQRQLRALGFNPGGVDGAFGPETAAAVRAYQQAYRLPETGRLDDVTLRSLLPETRQGALR
jgi:peptidoglycan hydrolase-like protein with peptidoglycan-binding domain